MGCYAQDDEEGEGCQSGVTYKQGFRDARERLSALVSMYENVRDVANHKTDKHGTKHRPEIETVVEDLELQGCHFTWRLCDTAKFLLPQRRKRVYGVASMGEQRPERMTQDFDAAMTMMETFGRCGFNMFPRNPNEVLHSHVHNYICI